MTVTIIVGLPGSGKTTYAKTLPGRLFDDVAMSRRGMDDLKAYLSTGSDAVITDVFNTAPAIRSATEETIRRAANDSNITINWVFFENDPEACYHNVIQRNAGSHAEFKLISWETIKEKSAVYTIPEGAVTRKVYRP